MFDGDGGIRIAVVLAPGRSRNTNAPSASNCLTNERVPLHIMTLVVVPVRYPLTEHSRATLETAIDVAGQRDADLTVLHVNLYQNGHRVTRADLREAVESEFGRLSRTGYSVTSGLLVEETILEEVVSLDADVVVIGEKQAGRWRSMVRRLTDETDVGEFLRTELDCEIVTAGRA